MSNAAAIQDYFHRQYVTMEGNIEENIYAMFDENVRYTRADGNTVSIETIIQTVTSVHQTPENERVVMVTDFREEGNGVAFHMFLQFRRPDSGELVVSESDPIWYFNDEGKVIQAKQQ